jgi:hypothetical protein
LRPIGMARSARSRWFVSIGTSGSVRKTSNRASARVSPATNPMSRAPACSLPAVRFEQGAAVVQPDGQRGGPPARLGD